MKAQRFLRRLCICMALFLLVGSITVQAIPSPGWIPATWEARHDYYLKSIGCNSMHRKGRGIYALATVPGSEAQALGILSERYKMPEKWPEYMRAIIVEAIMQHLASEPMLDLVDQVAANYQTPRDAWLWYRVLENRLERKGHELAAQTYASLDRDIFSRLAALESIHQADFSIISELILNTIQNPDEKVMKKFKGLERELTLASAVSLLRKHKPSLTSDEYGKVFEAFMPYFDDKKVSDDCKLRMGRNFREIYGNQEVYVNSYGWRRTHYGNVDEQEQDVEKKERRTGSPPPPLPRPRFAGIEATGTRIAYVIDMSDSMLNPVQKPEKAPEDPEEDSGPVTGKGSKRKDKDKEKEKGDGLPTEADLPWDKIKNRFDLSREYLRISLKRLEREKGLSFCVVLFNEDAEYCKSTTSMIPLNPNTVARVMKELDDIKPRMIDGDKKRPYGTLSKNYGQVTKTGPNTQTVMRGGSTNLHGGLRKAFAANRSKPEMDYNCVNPKMLSEGCDTVFLLSDGAPTDSDFVGADPKEPDDNQVDDVENPTAGSAPITVYSGPYRDAPWIPNDLIRLNFYRHAEVHCIGIGEASGSLLNGISSACYGKTVMLGN